jgi:hypothetical protein
MDHLSVAVIPKAACHPSDPARVIVFNFRTASYNTNEFAEILAFDIPDDGWTQHELDSVTSETPGMWYTFDNRTFDGRGDEANAPRDASGIVMANGGTSILNIGGINQVRNALWKKGKKNKKNGPKVFSTWYSTIRELNVCTKSWNKVADLGVETFALMAGASTKLNMAFFCGGSMQRQDFHGNTEWCFGIRIPGIDFWNHRAAAVHNFTPGFRMGESGNIASQQLGIVVDG